jgi:hypothetical protein
MIVRLKLCYSDCDIQWQVKYSLHFSHVGLVLNKKLSLLKGISEFFHRLSLLQSTLD